MNSLLFVVLLGCIGVSLGQSVTGLVQDSTKSSANAVAGAIVKFTSPSNVVFQATTVADGSYNIPALPPANYTVKVTATGYYDYDGSYEMALNQSVNSVNFFLSPSLPSGFRFILLWAATPSDLDIHLFTPWECETYYGQRMCTNGSTSASLDRDETSGFGPETMTITKTGGAALTCGTYELWVHIFTTSGSFRDSQAVIEVYQEGRGRLSVQAAPNTNTNSDNWWRVVRLNIDETGNAVLEYKNTAATAKPTIPFADAVTCDASHVVSGVVALLLALFAILF